MPRTFDDEIQYDDDEQPAAPAAPAPRSATCDCASFILPSQALPLAVRGVCPRCSRPRARRAPTSVAPAAQPAILNVDEPSAPIAASLPDVQQNVRSTQTVAQQLAHREVVARTQQTSVVEVVSVPAQPQLRKGDIVAGAAAEGHGVLLAFTGRGSMERAQLLATLSGAGFPDDWAPRPKSAHAQAGRILGSLNASGFVVRADRTRSQLRDQRGNPVASPTWHGRWFVARTGRAVAVGDRMGQVIVTATLDENDVLQLQATDAVIAERIRDEYDAAIAAELYSATDVSDWLKGILVSKFRAARLGGTWYVKRRHAAAAEKLLTAFSVVWGENFLLPALPVASSEQLRTGIAQSFGREVDELLAEYREKRDEARAEKPAREMNPRTAATLHAKLRAMVERCVGFSALLGDAHVAPLRAKCIAASEEIQESMSGIAIRFGLIFDELARDAR